MSDFDQIVEEFFKNYQDRGMKKWSGFYLSDHTLKMNKDQAKRNARHPKKEEMSLDEISELLLEAFSNHYYVKVQLKQRDSEGQYGLDIAGFVEGYHETIILISGQRVDLENINHISLMKKDS